MQIVPSRGGGGGGGGGEGGGGQGHVCSKMADDCAQKLCIPPILLSSWQLVENALFCPLLQVHTINWD